VTTGLSGVVAVEEGAGATGAATPLAAGAGGATTGAAGGSAALATLLIASVLAIKVETRRYCDRAIVEGTLTGPTLRVSRR
jgi:hypothetical protein